MTPIQEIKEKFDKVIKYSQKGIDEPKTERLFDIWFKKKKDIIEAFGGNFIYEIPGKVSFELTEEAKSDRIQNFINFLWEFGYDELGRFLEHQRDGFYKNSVIEEYKITDAKGTVITKNTKLIKAFKYFIKNETILNELQSKASQIIQENKVEGTLCFSVHPLDYLSISENTYNWRSCHALDGEYRAGNLSYMMDSSTIVCYLKGENEVKLPHFPDDVLWNNKKWRVLLYLSNDWRMIFAGKQYPFSTESGMQILIDKCFNYKLSLQHQLDDILKYPLSTNCRWTNWSNVIDSIVKEVGEDVKVHISFNHEYIPTSSDLVKLQEIVTDAKGSKHFNDVLKSSCYKPVYSYLVTKEPWRDYYYCNINTHTKFEIGGMTYCLRCGQEEVLDSCSTMMCYNCEFKYGVSENESFGYCACCGDRIEMDKSYFIDDDIYCADCYAREAERCVNCGDSLLKQNMHFDKENEAYYCHWCWCDFND